MEKEVSVKNDAKAVAPYEEKLRQYYGDMLVFKSSANSKFFSALSLPAFMRDWLVMRFSNDDGVIDKQEVSNYVKRVIPNKEQWNEYLVDLLHITRRLDSYQR